MPERIGPVCRFEFENGTVEYDHAKGGQFVAKLADGRVRNYGQPEADRMEKLWQSIDAAGNKDVTIACDAAAAIPHAKCVVAARESCPEIIPFPASLRRTAIITGERMTWIDGLSESLTSCFEEGKLPAENDCAPGPRAGRRVAIDSVLRAKEFVQP